MVHRCCISSCGMNVRVAEAKGLSYHGFPNKEPLREQWIQAIIPHLDKPETFKVVPKYTRVCSRHFRKKDYAVDVKKRARLNSNAVPSVFPRKNSPIVIPNVLPSPTKGKSSKTDTTATGTSSTSVKSDPVPIPGATSTSTLTNPTSTGLSVGRASCDDATATRVTESAPSLLATISWKLPSLPLQSSCDGGGSPEDHFGPTTTREFHLTESSSLGGEEQLVLTIQDTADGGVSSSSISQEDLSQSSNFSLNEEDSNEVPYKKRKRRKWNRSAFDRPSKGKKKGPSEDDDHDVSIDGVGEALAEISLSTLLAIATPDLKKIRNPIDNPAVPVTKGGPTTTIANTSASATRLQTVSLPLDSSTVQSINMHPDQVQHLSSIEQELLQSIQAVSLHCGGEPEGNANENTNDQDRSSHQHLIKLQHSSAESEFSTEDDEGLVGTTTTTLHYHQHHLQSPNSSPTEGGLLTQIVGIELDDDERASAILEIDNLAQHFNSSLLTGYNVPITLSIGLEDLHLPDSHSAQPDQTPSTASASSSSEDIHSLLLVDNNLRMPGEHHHNHYHHYQQQQHHQDFCRNNPSGGGSNASSPGKPNNRKKKAPDNYRLAGVSKKHKKEKICGQFSVERFMNSDKDIEYYTGFCSYKNFEAFFRSLEAYVERLRVTDVMFGVANLDNLQADPEGKQLDTNGGGGGGSASSDSEFLSPLPPPPAFDEPQKRRPFHGRSMSRIDELFMTVIRLRRKLPEKVLGHMFCISQPTVSRIIRAWTVLLSKLIDCYPVENEGKSSKSGGGKGGGAVKTEHSYTSKGLGIPDSFRQLFNSELAQSIVVTSVSAKDKKAAAATATQQGQKNPSASSPTPPFMSSTPSKRSKKSRTETLTGGGSSLLDHSPTRTTTTNTDSSSDFPDVVVTESVVDLLDPSSNLFLDDADFFQPVNFLG